MYEVIKSLKISSSVLSLKVLDDKIVLLTNQYLLLFIDKKSLEITYQKQITNKFEAKHSYDKSFAISSNLDFLITTSSTNASFLLKYTNSLKNINKIQANKGELYCCEFNHKSDTLAIGGEDGKVFFYSIIDNKIVNSLKTRPDYISDIKYSKDDKFAAISSFDKTTIIYSFDISNEIKSFDTKSVVERSIFIHNSKKLVSVTRDKKFIVSDIQTGVITESEFIFNEWPSSMIDINDNYTVVGTRGNTLYIINHTNGTILSSIIFDNIGIVSIEVDSSRLYITFADGEIKIIDMNSHIAKFKLNIKLNKFSQASKLIEENIFLATDESASKFDEEWINILYSTKKLIVENKEDEAKKLASPFFFDSNKKDEFLFCLGHIAHYKQFSDLIKEKKYIDAFKLADKFEFLKKSKDFEALEKHFLKIFHHCKLLFSKDELESIQSAKKIILPYSQVLSKKSLVNNLISKHKIFINADRLIKERKFRQYFTLVKQNEFLQEEELYNKVILIGNVTFNKLNIYEQEQNYDKAIDITKYLKDFLPIKGIVEEKEKRLIAKQNVQKYIEENDIENLYKLVLEEPSIDSYIPFIKYHENFLALKEKAHEFANNGDVKNVLTLLNNYLSIEYTIHNVAQEFKIAYLMQIKMHLENSYEIVNWNLTILKYKSMFGLDNELINILDELNFNEDIEDVSSSDTFNGYVTNGFEDSVIVLIE